ncbi:Nucleolar protein 12 [Nowakowskiella sp. JEL0407]|nr:Nucleolar protein 12 [Nowakowskiella sp. JEL0407]
MDFFKANVVDDALDSLFKSSTEKHGSVITTPKASHTAKPKIDSDNAPVISAKNFKPKEKKKRKKEDMKEETDNSETGEKDVEDVKQVAVKEKRRKVDSEDEDVPEEIKKPEDDPEKLERTVFVGNVDTCVTEKAGKNEFIALFKQHGEIDSVRFRSIAFAKQIPRKAAYAMKQLHPERDTLNAYVVYKDKESVPNALKLNSQLFKDKHLRVDGCTQSDGKYDVKRSVFIGNLPFDLSSEALYAHFQECGDIVNLIYPGRVTNVGKGFGYVQFSERPAVPLALKLDGSELCKRKIRVSRCDKELSNKQAQSKPTTATKVLEGEHAAKRRITLKSKNKKSQKSGGKVVKKKDSKKTIQKVKGKPTSKKFKSK